MNINDKEFWDKFRKNEVIVNCETEEELEEFLTKCETENITWCDGSNPTEGSNPWKVYASRTCLDNRTGNDGMSYGNTEFYESKKYVIIKFKDLKYFTNVSENMSETNKKLEIVLKWVKEKEEENGIKADEASDLNRETAYMRYNHVWSTYGQVRKYIEELLKS